MPATYTWSFPHFEVAKSEDGFTNVVKTIHWRYDAVDGDVSAGAYGSVGLPAPSSDSFVSYEQIVGQWAVDNVSSLVDIPALQASLEAQIQILKNPLTVLEAPPFTAA